MGVVKRRPDLRARAVVPRLTGSEGREAAFTAADFRHDRDCRRMRNTPARDARPPIDFCGESNAPGARMGSLPAPGPRPVCGGSRGRPCESRLPRAGRRQANLTLAGET